jgi:hypothetical protein
MGCLVSIIIILLIILPILSIVAFILYIKPILNYIAKLDLILRQFIYANFTAVEFIFIIVFGLLQGIIVVISDNPNISYVIIAIFSFYAIEKLCMRSRYNTNLEGFSDLVDEHTHLQYEYKTTKKRLVEILFKYKKLLKEITKK